MGIERLSFPSGDLATNSTLFWCSRTREGILVDPGGEPEEILDLALRQGVAIQTILLTHAHVDNLAAVPLLRDETSCGVALHKADWPLWESIAEQCAELGMPVPDLPELDEDFEDGDIVDFGHEHLEVLHLPGHTPGLCGFAFPSLGLCLVGDSCFAVAAGRTDLWLGNDSDQERTLDRLERLPSDWELFPGHGPGFSPGCVAKARQRRSTNI
jgi:glyoxylase-like metal-dependent hydrolase (beta-lactamase superfamily II)